MPLFICDCCGAVDNTACGGNYWSKNLADDPDLVPDLCCKCHTGKWHNKFPYEVCTAEVFNEIGEDNFIYKFPVQNPRRGAIVMSGGEGYALRNRATKSFPFVIGMASASGYNPIPHSMRKPARPKVACQLPGCQNTTRHRGGYCCPEHCREHRSMQGKKVKALGR